jgi:hypothetical protein
MSKTVRGILRGPGTYFCLYSPEFVEEEFCEVHLQDPEYPSLLGWAYAAFTRSHG